MDSRDDQYYLTVARYSYRQSTFEQWERLVKSKRNGNYQEHEIIQRLEKAAADKGSEDNTP